MKRMMIILMLVLCSAGMALAQTGNDVNFMWGAPTTGSPVDYYVFESSVNGGAFAYVATVTDTTYTFFAEALNVYIVRVVAVDAQDRHGPYSENSEPLILDFGPPGPPGKPIVIGG